MNSTDNFLFLSAFMSVIGVFIVITLISGGVMDIGCHVIGTEVNGDNSTEYLQVGNCYY